MIRFTGHAIDRYLDFHAIGDPSMTPEGARLLLDQHGESATRTGRYTHRGDEIWEIAALGIQVIGKPEGDDVIVVTVLPPRRLQGLTPIQAERVEALLGDANARAAANTEAQATLVYISPQEINPTDPPEVKAAKYEARAIAKAANTEREQRRLDLKAEAAAINASREILVPLLRTMRHEITSDRTTRELRYALRAALRFIVRIPLDQTGDVRDQIRAINPGLLSDEFIAHETEPTEQASAAFLASRRVKST